MADAHTDPARGSVLFVDDEQGILRALQRLFRGASFEVRTANGAEEALRELAARAVDLVIADMRMPDVDGIELLRRVRALYPGTGRAILTGQVDRDSAVRALADGTAKTFFAKPWIDEALRGRIEHLLLVHAELRAQGMVELIANVGALPAIPAIYAKLVRAMEEGRALAEIAGIVEWDVALTARILQIVNSALYGRSGIATAERAITLLGLETVRGVILMSSLSESSAVTADERADLDRIVAHSVLAHRFTMALRPACPAETPDIAGSAALLHDAGKLLLLRSLPDRYRALCAYQSAHAPCTFLEAEAALGMLATSHARLGGFLFDEWNLPEPIIEAALFHHEPERAAPTVRALVGAIAWVDRGINTAFTGAPFDDPAPASLVGERAAAVRSSINALR